ncbi:MAG: NPCBM/NEW2 domain-containing protein, partial [Flaviramulus sp.]|nr:NPCBM/NEW2 domain-containing protein [Flaviramulus sp.]
GPNAYDHADWAGAVFTYCSEILEPTIPTLSSIAQSDTTVDLSWTASTSNVAITNYNIYKDGVLETTLGDVLTYQVSGLTADTTYNFTVTATDANGVESAPSNTLIITTDVTPTDPVCNLSEVNLSDLNWVSAQQGWSTARLNTNLNGNPLTINGQTFTHGIGTHAQSQIIYDLTTGDYQSFKSYIGIDDNVSSGLASVQFEILGDGVSLFRSQTLTATDDAQLVEVPINGLSQLTLVVHSMGPNAYDHADWAGAVFTYCDTLQNTIASKINDAIVAPFTFLDITTINDTHMVDIQWETANDLGIDMYVVERSVDGHHYTVVNDQPSIKSNKQSGYMGNDYNPVIGKSYYRVVGITAQGEKIYSYEVAVDFEIFQTKVMVYPNPVRKNQKLTADIFVDNAHQGDLNISIFTIEGKLIETRSRRMNKGQAFELFKVSDLESGLYILEVKGSDWTRIERFVVK